MKNGCMLDKIYANPQNAFIVCRMYRKITADSIPTMRVVMRRIHLNLN